MKRKTATILTRDFRILQAMISNLEAFLRDAENTCKGSGTTFEYQFMAKEVSPEKAEKLEDIEVLKAVTDKCFPLLTSEEHHRLINIIQKLVLEKEL